MKSTDNSVISARPGKPFPQGLTTSAPPSTSPIPVTKPAGTGSVEADPIPAGGEGSLIIFVKSRPAAKQKTTLLKMCPYGASQRWTGSVSRRTQRWSVISCVHTARP